MDNLIEKIKKAKQVYGISYAFMGEILGFGPNQIRLYVNGAKPNRSNELALSIALTPFGMKTYLDNSPKMIKDRKEFPKLYLKIQAMCFDIERDLQRIKGQANENYIMRVAVNNSVNSEK